MPFSRWHRPPGGLYARAGSGAEDACGPFPSSVMQALRGVLHAWVELEEDWTSVPPITRPVPLAGLPNVISQCRRHANSKRKITCLFSIIISSLPLSTFLTPVNALGTVSTW